MVGAGFAMVPSAWRSYPVMSFSMASCSVAFESVLLCAPSLKCRNGDTVKTICKSRFPLSPWRLIFCKSCTTLFRASVACSTEIILRMNMLGSCLWQLETATPLPFKKKTNAVPSVMKTTSVLCKKALACVAYSFNLVTHSSRLFPESEPCASQQYHVADSSEAERVS